MKKAILCGLVLSIAAGFLSAGDVASFVDKGFSEDGKYYVFGQYGKTDKKFQGWAEIYQVDIAANDYVDSGVFKTNPSSLTADKNGKDVYDVLEYKNKDYLRQLNCQTADFDKVWYVLDSTQKTGTEEIVFKDFIHGEVENYDTYKLRLIPTINGKGKYAKSSFYIDMRKYDSEGNLILQKKIGTPSINRKGVVNYKIERIMCDPSETSLIIVIEKQIEDDAGLLIRYMVEAAKLD